MILRSVLLAILTLGLTGLLMSPEAVRAGGQTFVVNDAGDEADANAGDGTCETSAGGPCTLRAAIEESNANDNLDRDAIHFDLGGGTPTIVVGATGLPAILEPIEIDGNSGGATRVELAGQLVGPSISGLTLDEGENSIIANMVINRFTLRGIDVFAHAAGAMIRGNYLGTDVTGLQDLGNANAGIAVNARSVVVGGSKETDRNVISGNEFAGIAFLGNASDNVVIGNYIGVGADGVTALGNSSEGVRDYNSVGGNRIGGPGTEGNVISENQYGIAVRSAIGTVIVGNLIGTDASGTLDRGNGIGGVSFQSVSSANVGGDTLEDANVIAYNSTGIMVSDDATGVRIVRNSIHSNDGQAIDLALVEENDAQDGDAGANNGQNRPVLSAVAEDGTVEGDLNSTPESEFTLAFFASAVCDDSGRGEGEVFLGSLQVTTDGNGDAEFVAGGLDVPPAGKPSITALAVDVTGDTSEFSNCVSLGPALLWGDSDCSGAISSRDNQALLREVLDQAPLSQTEPCPDIGTEVVNGDVTRNWGDWDCSGAISSRDNQALLRTVLDQLALSQTEPCPDIGET